MQCHAAPHPVILVVEDNQSFRKSMQQILEEADFLVLPAANADQALELARHARGLSISCLPRSAQVACQGPIWLIVCESVARE
jgi:CheY-like chemotaxis protein